MNQCTAVSAGSAAIEKNTITCFDFIFIEHFVECFGRSSFSNVALNIILNFIANVTKNIIQKHFNIILYSNILRVF